MTPARHRPASRKRAAALALGAWLAVVVTSLALAQTAVAPPPAKAPLAAAPSKTAPRGEEGTPWKALTPAQREALAPLEREWPGIDAQRKQKWLAISERFRSLPPDERVRISERMTEWARLTPSQRGEVRLRYQESKQVPAPDRSARWQAYQNLPPEQKQQFAARAAPSAPVTAASAAASKRDLGDAKANVVPNPALVRPPRPVAPTVVQATPGATTRLITRPTTPPAHQQAGLPKIAATPEFVNRSTLLPKRGPQAAAVTPFPAEPAPASVPPPPPAAPKPTEPSREP